MWFLSFPFVSLFLFFLPCHGKLNGQLKNLQHRFYIFLGKPEFCCASLYLEALTCEAVSKAAVTAFHDAERLEVSVFYLPSHPGGLKENYESTAPSPGAQKELQ